MLVGAVLSGSTRYASLAELVAALVLLLRWRRRSLQALHILVGALVVAAPVLALLLAPLAAGGVLLQLPGAWALYLLVDAALLFVWRRRVLQAWSEAKANLGVLAEAVATLPNLPRPSVDAVLRTLPVLPPLRDRDLEPDARHAIAAFSDWCWTEVTASALLPSLLVAVPSTWAAMLLIARTLPNAGPAAIVAGLNIIVIMVRLGLPLEHKRRLLRALARVAPERRAAVLAVARDLDWSGLSDPRRLRMLRTLERNQDGG